ncbi:transketolase [candidate division KSB1 bacterium]|nr:transketolase [candidate division KSB1 bacterium]RQW00830.1 MAG: transketolase [candidate division KSB1 bacterium]
MNELEQKSANYRRKILKYIKLANAGHTGGDLSCIDIINVLYNRVMNISPYNFDKSDRDRYIQSKGHSVEALYVVLADCGFFPEHDLETMCRYQSHYVGHPTRQVYGIEHNTGALGHGLSVSVGMAIAGKMDALDYRVFCLLGDGELVEGSNWEAALAAAHYKLDNLIAIVDYNQLQITGRTRDVCRIDPVLDKFVTFGWAVDSVNGHDVAELTNVLLHGPLESNKPSLILARTIKGKGVSFMENDATWHHRVPTETEYALALQEIDNSTRMD